MVETRRRVRHVTGDELVPAREAGVPSPSTMWLWYLLVGVGAVLAWSSVHPTADLQLFVRTPIVALAVAGAAFGAARNAGPARTGWQGIAVGSAVMLAAEIVRVSDRLATKHGFPSIADVLMIVAYLVWAWSLLTIVRRHEVVADRANLLDALTVTLALTALMWYVFVEQYTAASNVPLTTKVIVVARPIAWLLVGALVLRLVFVVGRHNVSMALLVAGFAGVLASDMALGIEATSRTYRTGDLVDLASLAALLLLGAAALHPAAEDVKPAAPAPTGRIRILTMLTVSIASPVLLMVAAWSEARLAGVTLVAAIGAMGTFTLVSLRLWSLVSLERRTAALQSASRLGALVQNSKDAIYVVDVHGVITYASPGVAGITGSRPGDVVGVPLASCFPPDEAANVSRQLLHASTQTHGESVECHGKYVDGHGSTCDFEMTIVNLLHDPNVEGIVVTMRDVTTRRRLEQELKQRALRDDLTGLANRALFMDRLEHALLRLQRAPGTIAVLFIDLDDFKAVNDGLGHAAGDALLVAVAERLGQCLRPSDTVARLGGDEFAVLLDDLESHEAGIMTAERLLETLQLPVPIGDLAVNVPASVGIAIVDEPTSPESLMRDADIALYRAKGEGKGRVAEFDTSMRWEAYERLRLRTELARVVEQQELDLVFQPIVSVDSGEIVGAEALVRWEHPKLGTIPPLDFIPLAEETGIILTIGRWVLETATRAAATWARTHGRDIYVSVNVSARQLREPSFARDVQRILEESELPPELLMLELTESVLVDEVAAENLVELIVPLGVAIAIDDFGTGYSSLAYLQRFPVDVVKIDRSFVSQMDDKGMRAVMESIGAIAGVMGYVSVAEGVETDAQLDGITQFDYHFAQGFRYSRPVNAATLDRLLFADEARQHGAAQNPHTV